MKNLTKEQDKEVTEVYNLFCKSNNGYIGARDLKICFKALGFSVKHDEIKLYINKYDITNHGQIDLQGFKQIMAEKMSTRDSREEILKAFKLFDEDNKGYITFADLKKVSIELGENLSDEQIQNMINQADTSGKGEISESEFVRIMKKTNIW